MPEMMTRTYCEVSPVSLHSVRAIQPRPAASVSFEIDEKISAFGSQ